MVYWIDSNQYALTRSNLKLEREFKRFTAIQLNQSKYLLGMAIDAGFQPSRENFHPQNNDINLCQGRASLYSLYAF
jgi:hypothetical protein